MNEQSAADPSPSSAQRNNAHLLGGLVALGAWALLLQNQLPATTQPTYCWFYNPALHELSFSELASALGWLAAAMLAVRRRHEHQLWLFVVVLTSAASLEECNYGLPIASVALGRYRPGVSIHNLVYGGAPELYSTLEAFVIEGSLATVGVLLIVFAWQRRTTLSSLLPASVPLLAVLMTEIRVLQRRAMFGVNIAENHPCVQTRNELLELLLALSVLALVVVWPRRPEGDMAQRGRVSSA